jgi:hypothetical protein
MFLGFDAMCFRKSMPKFRYRPTKQHGARAQDNTNTKFQTVPASSICLVMLVTELNRLVCSVSSVSVRRDRGVPPLGPGC